MRQSCGESCHQDSREQDAMQQSRETTSLRRKFVQVFSHATGPYGTIPRQLSALLINIFGRVADQRRACRT